MELSGRLIGVFYGYAFRGTLYHFQGGFDPQHEKLRIGQCLMAYAIESAIGEGCSCLDMLRGDYEYKKRWAANVRQTLSYTLSGHTLPTYMNHVLQRLILPARSRGGRLFKRLLMNRR
jgi:CelD/BcsL family acetyltransferase involved in cellulose biosynthesis